MDNVTLLAIVVGLRINALKFLTSYRKMTVQGSMQLLMELYNRPPLNVSLPLGWIQPPHLRTPKLAFQLL